MKRIETIRTALRFVWPLASLILVSCSESVSQQGVQDADAVLLFSDASVTDIGPSIDAFVRPDAEVISPDAGLIRDIGTGIDAGMHVYETIVLLDGVPSPDTVVLQGGALEYQRTDESGRAFVPVDWSEEGDIWILASHPKARIWGAYLTPDQASTPIVIELESYDDSDNLDYKFSSPGEPQDRPTTNECGHCHQTINDAWFESPHSRAASNPKLHDWYRGSAYSLSSQAECEAAGGRWQSAPTPGDTSDAMQCFLDESVLSHLNSDCEQPPCGSGVSQYGGCADCHAPGINGVLGGRDLRDAQGVPFKYGVHCDVCHRIEDIDMNAPPGIAGRLKLLRPSESAIVGLGGGGYLPMTFGPSHDVQNPRMGSVQRDHFRQAEICAGCHQHSIQVEAPGQVIDRTRWPVGKLPVQSTYEEWKTGPLSPGAPCQSCHMPPDAQVSNGADLQRYPFATTGLQGGYVRPAGHVRAHSWVGPRSPESQVLELAAAIFINKSSNASTVTATVTVKNVGCGHALPTGEPMRHIILLVEAYCDQVSLPAVSGSVVPFFGGRTETKFAGENWNEWNQARVGDKVRIVDQTGGFYDYDGFGPFALGGRFGPEEKGMPVESFVGMSTIIAVHTSSVTYDHPLPAGDVAYLVTNDGYAGHPGFGFARVTADRAGRTMIPHFLAEDILSDNRLLPQKTWSSHHEFSSSCTDPTIRAKLVYRPYAYQEAKKRNWTFNDRVMTEAKR